MANGDDSHTDGSNYGYTPTAAWCLAFIVLFSVSAAVHALQAWRSRYWVIYPTLVLGALIEVLGWSGRYWSSQNVTLLTPFLMQICTLIMAPVFFSAYDYILLGTAIKKLGPQYSLLKPSWYFIFFLVADLISLILQAVGGGQAASSAADSAPTTTATDIMVAGIIFQLISMVLFVALGFDFILRATSKRPYAFQERRIALAQSKKAAKAKEQGEGNSVVDAGVLRPRMDSAGSEETRVGGIAGDEAQMQLAERSENLTRWWVLLGAALVSSLMIVTRGVYRSIELKQGWTSHLMTTEIYQNILDALVMVIAVGIFNFVHPWYLLGRKPTWRGYH